MANGQYLEEIEKWPYLRNSSTDRHEFRHGDAHWPSKPKWRLKF